MKLCSKQNVEPCRWNMSSKCQYPEIVEELILSHNKITTDKIENLPIFPKTHTLDLSHNCLDSSFIISSLCEHFPFLRVKKLQIFL